MALNDKNLDSALEALEDDVIRIARGGGDVASARLAIEMRRELKQTIDKHYGGWARKTTKGYSKVAGAILKSFGKLPLPANFADLTDVDRDVVSGLQKMTFSGFEDVGATFLEDMSKGLYQNTLAGRPFSEFEKELRQSINGVYIRSDDPEIEELVGLAKNGTPAQAEKAINKLHTVYARDKIGRNLRNYAKAYAHDSIMEFDATFNAHKAEEAGLTHFQYYGSLIVDSRPLCRAMAGKVFTKEEMRDRWRTFSDRKGTKSGDPMIVRGGWNCRHHWQAVKPEWIDEPVEERVEEKIDEEIKPSRKFKSTVDAQKHLNNRGITANLKGMKVDTANAFVGAVDNLPEGMDTNLHVGNFANWKKVTGRKLGARANKNYGISIEQELYDRDQNKFIRSSIVGVNTTRYKTLDAITERKRFVQKAYREKSGRDYFFNIRGEQTVHHEMGHIVQNHILRTKEWGEWEGISRKWYQSSEVDILKSSHEAFAEAWSAFHTGDKSRLPSDVSSFVKKVKKMKKSRFWEGI